MKDKHKNMKDIDLFTELTLSQQEQINGAIIGQFTFPPFPPVFIAWPFGHFVPPPPPPEKDWFIVIVIPPFLQLPRFNI